MARLAARHCTTLKKATKPIREAVAQSLLKQLDPAWQLSRNNKIIQRIFRFNDFQQTIGFVNAVAWIANHEDHHPDLKVAYNRCEVSYTSHVARGLTANDFICAAKIDLLIKKERAAKTAAKQVDKTSTIEVIKADEKDKGKGKPLAFDAAEADALLSKKTPPKTDTVAKQEEEDEFELIDPDEVATEKHLPDLEQTAAEKTAETAQPKNTIEPATVTNNAKVTAPTPEPKPTALNDVVKPTKPEKVSVAGESLSKKPSPSRLVAGTPKPRKSEDDLVATVILPPGMESVGQAASIDNKDIESTLVIPPEESPTPDINAKSAGSEKTGTLQDTIKTKRVSFEENAERTMVLAPKQVEEITAEAKSIKKAADLQAAEDQLAEEDEGDSTMILASNPKKALSEQPTTAEKVPDTTGQQQKNAASSEDELEKTLPLTSPPPTTGRSQSQPVNTESAVKNTASTNAQTGAHSKQEKTDSSIEDDETLVMHKNTYKPVKQDPK